MKAQPDGYTLLVEGNSFWISPLIQKKPYELGPRTSLLAVGKSPRITINRLNQEIVRALNTAEIEEKFLNAGVETVSNTPEEFVASIKSETTRMAKVIQAAGIKAD